MADRDNVPLDDPLLGFASAARRCRPTPSGGQRGPSGTCSQRGLLARVENLRDASYQEVLFHQAAPITALPW
jgi:hypothetical protein